MRDTMADLRFALIDRFMSAWQPDDPKVVPLGRIPYGCDTDDNDDDKGTGRKGFNDVLRRRTMTVNG